jgi:2-amino-4-hydroxy-6-hydroxymethyldihydropteridine diphosphokinase
MTSAPVLIALGSNLGDREGQMRQAECALELWVDDWRMSALIETEPMYVVEQPRFLNAVGFGNTRVGPIQLLRILKEIELEIGRLPRIRNGPREIDLDLIAYGSLRLRAHVGGYGSLVLPHPRAIERDFVTLPAMEVAAKFFEDTYGPGSLRL